MLTPIVGCLLDLLTIPLTIRRLHDSGRSGWWWGIGALLKVGFIVFLCYDIVMAIINEDNLVGYEDQLAMTLILKYGVYSIAIAIYQVILLVLCCLDSEQVENKYGSSPKYIEIENV